ncbi:MAG: four-helix bundle copper-binding protein [Moraxellaceae bacterium]
MANQLTMSECIDNCLDCHRVCLETLGYALKQQGKLVRDTHLRLLVDCEQICQTSADFMLRSSDLHTHTCKICAEICQHCAELCHSFSEDQQMQACEHACRRCAESCQQIATAA